MKINLRNATLIQEQVRKALSEVERPLSVSVEVPITVGDNIGAVVETASTKFFDDLKSAQTLRLLLYGIRKNIGRQNALSGVDDLISDRVNVKEQIATLTRFKNATVFDSDAIRRTLDLQNAKMKSGNGYYNDEVAVSVISAEQLASIKQEIVRNERLLRDINDRILALNVNTFVEISDNDYTYLESQGIV